MKDSEFSESVHQIFSFIIDIIEVEDKEGIIDIDFNNDILNLTTAYGIYVINKQSVLKQLWLSSPTSGPVHFDYKAGEWKSTTGIVLLELLENELNIEFSKYNNHTGEVTHHLP